MKKSIFILSLGILLAGLFSFTSLDFFSSMTKVDYIDGTKTLKFTTKLNTTHISQAVKIDPETAGFEAEVKKYVNNNVDVAINGADKQLTFTGSQVNGESVWVYYEASGVSDISSLKIRNSILIGQFPKQVNIVNITYKGAFEDTQFPKGERNIGSHLLKGCMVTSRSCISADNSIGWSCTLLSLYQIKSSSISVRNKIRLWRNVFCARNQNLYISVFSCVLVVDSL